MITKFKQSWLLFKASVRVALQYRKLLWFPVLTTMFSAFIALFFLSATILPMALHKTGYNLNQKQHWKAVKEYYLPASKVRPRSSDSANSASAALRTLITGRSASVDKSGNPVARRGFSWGSLTLLAFYFLSMFLATFFNVAFYSEIIAALNGKGVSLRRGFNTARSRLPSILAWSLLAGLVGWMIRSIEQRLPTVARIVTGFIGIAWSIAAVFAIPVIIQEQPMRNPMKILRQSAATLKRTWGEGLIGYVGFSAASAMIFVCSLLPLLVAGALAFHFKSVSLIIVAGAIWMLCVLCIAYISSVASNIYRCALYMYAAEGVIPEPYNLEFMDMAWKVKKS